MSVPLILDGRELSKKIRNGIRDEIAGYRALGLRRPGLAVIL
ncbi:MAG TPA: bifunctional methylenetetrahydrofolate dehydrogenase/methenyltetrahydrofolate cyclohydrolase, partial [Aquifex aeolicus]|nr:bifunctional methylenetetrahydrofolate dehydrogenase/methenyltetrahydrofolate cyclohydrolase [Aquifex aeolicus]